MKSLLSTWGMCNVIPRFRFWWIKKERKKGAETNRAAGL